MSILDVNGSNTMADIYQGLFLEDQKQIEREEKRRFEFEPIGRPDFFTQQFSMNFPTGMNREGKIVFTAKKGTPACEFEYKTSLILFKQWCFKVPSPLPTEFIPWGLLDTKLINRVANTPIILPTLDKVRQIWFTVVPILKSFGCPKDMRELIATYVFGRTDWRVLSKYPFYRLSEIMKLDWFDLKKQSAFHLKNEPVVVFGNAFDDFVIYTEIVGNWVITEKNGLLFCQCKPYNSIRDVYNYYSPSQKVIKA